MKQQYYGADVIYTRYMHTYIYTCVYVCVYIYRREKVVPQRVVYSLPSRYGNREVLERWIKTIGEWKVLNFLLF